MNYNLPHIIFEDEHLIILYKPSLYYVHPPENKYAKQQVGRNTCLHWLEDHYNLKPDPIHRLDFATEGLIIFGKTRPVTQKLNLMMRSREIQKYYEAIVRGWFPESYGKIELALETNQQGLIQDCVTVYSTKKKIELNTTINSSFKTSRYSWLDLDLQTGRWHQIRRHMNRVSHPVIGDTQHGDTRHNKYFREILNIEGLCLKANRIKMTHPIENKIIELHCPVSPKWEIIQKLFN